jgi:Carboxypeptidase regulatory-like domain
MKAPKVFSLIVGAVVLISLAGTVQPVSGQTAAAATVSGVVSDASGAVVSGAKVVLLDKATGLARSRETNSTGQFIFANVLPGNDTVTVTMKDFIQTEMQLSVEVAKSYNVNVTLKVGASTKPIDVTVGAGVELQTLDAMVGNVVQGEQMVRLPNINRSAMVYYDLQPLVAPTYPTGGTNQVNSQATVAGSRSDQTTLTVDGIDATDNIIGASVKPDPANVVDSPVPLTSDSVQEFGVATTNSTASYGRGEGGQFTFVTKPGTNALHGALYEYLQNNDLNANTWDRNRVGIPNPKLEDNRFGVAVGAPIWKNRTFIFGSYEGRRFPQSSTISRVVPTDSLRAGSLRFLDASGTVRDYPLATSTSCGPGNTSACDPRGLGINPVVSTLWSHLPVGNDSTVGDGLNTIGFRSTVSTPSSSDSGIGRVDHNFSDNWHFMGSVRYSEATSLLNSQVDIGGLLKGDALGKPVAIHSESSEPHYFVVALTGVIKPTLTNDIRFGYLRDWWWFPGVLPFPQVPGIAGAIEVAGGASAHGGLLDGPVDMNTLVARTQGGDAKSYQVRDDLSWNKGHHLFQFGGDFRRIRTYHYRNDKVIGSITALDAELDAAGAVTIPAENRPPDCSATVTTFCLAAGDATRWNRLFAGTAGMIDNTNVLVTRDRNLNPLPLGSPLQANAYQNAVDFYFSDTWRIRPTLTITAGLNYQIQFAPVDSLGRTAFMIDDATGQTLTSTDYLNNARRAALQGNIYNPTLAWLPSTKTSKKTVFNTDYGNVGPRIAAAWTPSFENSLWQRLFGGKGSSVFRAGYSITYDRMNTVWSVIEPMLGPTFAQTINCRGPVIGGSCANSSNPTDAYRIGIDGPGIIPTAPAVSSPLVVGTPYGETFAYQPDPVIGTGHAHQIDFTIQRQLSSTMIVEAGYVGTLARNMREVNDITSAPYFYRDKASGQSFAAAYDNVSNQLRAGISAAAVTAQPWFENQIGPGGTITLATQYGSDFTAGLLRTLWQSMQFLLPQPITNLQVQRIWSGTDGGYSNYHAFFATLRMHNSKGLTLALNYTLAKSLDDIGSVQNIPVEPSSSFDHAIDYGPSFFDHRHVVTANWVYELPFGSGARFSIRSQPLNKVISDWYFSGIFKAASGLPLTVAESYEAWGGGDTLGLVGSGAIPINKPDFGNTVHSGVPGSGGVGTNGDPATGGSGLNIFANPEAVLVDFRPIQVSKDSRSARGVLRGLAYWNFDFSLAKRTPVREGVAFLFSADFLNAFNHVVFNDPILSMQDPASFGVISSQANNPRAIQFGLRLEF